MFLPRRTLITTLSHPPQHYLHIKQTHRIFRLGRCARKSTGISWRSFTPKSLQKWRKMHELIKRGKDSNTVLSHFVIIVALCNKIAIALCNTPLSQFVITSITLCNKRSQKIFLTSKVSSLSLLDSSPSPDDDVTSHVPHITMFAVRVCRSYRLYKERGATFSDRLMLYVARCNVFGRSLVGTSLTNLGSAYTPFMVLQAETSKLVPPCAILNITKTTLEVHSATKPA